MTDLSDASRVMAGVLLLSVTTIELGGLFVFRVVTGRQAATDAQRALFRAGHAHAGVLVILALLTQPFVDAVDVDGVVEQVARTGAAFAALLIPSGFFLSVARPGSTRPNRMIALVPAGAASLAAGVVTLGIALLAST